MGMTSLGLAVASAALAVASTPIKTDVEPVMDTVRAGEFPFLIVQLSDVNNRPAPAPKDLPVKISARYPSNAVEEVAQSIIRAGQSSATIKLPPPRATGLIYYWAKQQELFTGGTFVMVESARPAAGSISASPYIVMLRYSPQREFLANGKDPVTVHAFVFSRNDTPLPAFRITLFDSSGTINPVPLVIPQGQGSGTATLTSRSPGEVKVEYVSSVPRAGLDGDPVLKIPFGPPITALQLSVHPQEISLVDRANLVVRLVDEHGTPLATMRPRTVSLALDRGRGTIEKSELTIPAGASEARTGFSPFWWGTMAIAVSSPNLFTVTAPMEVKFPFALLGISLLGGLAGAYVLLLRNRRTKPWRVFVGALTGFVFYWACLFLSLVGLPGTIVLNPLSAFVLSVLGGWMGPEIFERLLARFGFAKEKAKARGAA
ncbi:MAG: Ig-like domain-containing protein [Bryobacterales bacterium]|nr:Ig-like domain-containing protein [Bryobacterales bacterium]